MREHHNRQSMNAYLDTPAGEALAMQHGSREHAAVALAEAEQQDRAWRQAQAETKAERYPDRYASVADAMRDIPDPLGGAAAWVSGTTDEIVAAGRRVNPAAGWRNLGGEPESGEPALAVAQLPGRPAVAADTRPPWARED